MYQNKVSLIGFLGKDACQRTHGSKTYTILSLATKRFHKGKQSGEYASSTEWHRLIVWGKLAEYASTLEKGAHLAIEGELRSRVYSVSDEHSYRQSRVWEIHLDSILKLDRAQRAEREEVPSISPPG